MSGIDAPEKWQADPANVKRVLIVATGSWFVFEHRDPRGVPLKIIERGALPRDCDAYELTELALRRNCGAVWLAGPESDLLWFDATDPVYTYHELSADGAICGLVAQRRNLETGKGYGLPLCIFSPAVNDSWGIAGILPRPGEVDAATRARALAEGVALAAFALGQQLRFSPSYTGNAILRRVLADHPREIPPLSQEWREKLYELRPSPVQWCVGDIATWAEVFLTDDSSIAIHIYDRNMSYVSSAREVPIGDPVPAGDTFHAHLPGLYHIAEVWRDSYERDIDGEDQWVWEPEARALFRKNRTGGYRIIEGYYWPKTQKLDLRTWSERIWTARRAARAVDSVAGRIAEAIVKKVGVSTVGRLIQHTGRAVVSSEQARAEGLTILSYESDDSGELTGNVEAEMRIGRDDLVCPHWWSTIISNANERLWHAIATYAPHDTVLAYVDQFYCLQRHPELDEKLDPNKIGGWKYSGSFRVPVADLERLKTMGAQELVKHFAMLQRKQRVRM